MWLNITAMINSLVARLDVRQEAGQALVEYALIIALIAILCMAALTAVQGGITQALTSIANAL